MANTVLNIHRRQIKWLGSLYQQFNDRKKPKKKVVEDDDGDDD